MWGGLCTGVKGFISTTGLAGRGLLRDLLGKGAKNLPRDGKAEKIGWLGHPRVAPHKEYSYYYKDSS